MELAQIIEDLGRFYEVGSKTPVRPTAAGCPAIIEVRVPWGQSVRDQEVLELAKSHLPSCSPSAKGYIFGKPMHDEVTSGDQKIQRNIYRVPVQYVEY